MSQAPDAIPGRRHAVVFGGSRGIGAACVATLARAGFAVAFTYVAHAEAARRLEQVPDVRAYAADIREEAAVAQAFDRAERDFGGRAEVVVANAGINLPPATVADFTSEACRRMVDTNLVGAFNVLRAAARRVADGGAIVAVSSSLARHVVPGFGPYSATKAAVEALTRSMARELAGRAVRVNAVAPGPVDTDLFRAGKTEEGRRRSAALSPWNRVGTPEEIAEVVAFLVSDRASWVNGQIVQPNGAMI